MLKKASLAAALACLLTGAGFAEELTATVHKISAEGIHEELGSITALDGGHGLKIQPDLKGLAPGAHAFHIHQKGDCGPGEKDGVKVAGLAAGGHYGGGHGNHDASHGKPIGDLPELVVAEDGSAKTAVMAHQLKVAELAGRSIMIHAKSEAEGAGKRVACGVFPK